MNGDHEQFWSRMSLADNADRARFPLLLQAADGEYLAALQSYTALSQAGVPTDLFVFPDEDHVKLQPAHRQAIYRRNLAWFDFWLKGLVPTDPLGREEAVSWDRMRRARPIQASIADGVAGR